jgi:hypothetical protein
MKPSSPFTIALLAATALCGAGCSRLTVEWTPGSDEITLAARGPRDAVLLVLAGPPNGPHLAPGDYSLWTTVGPDKPWSKGGMEVARVPFDDAGVARTTVKVGALPADVVLVQAIALSRIEVGRALAVSECVAVSRKDGALVVRSHLAEVLRSPAGWSFGAAAGLVLAGLLLRRVPVPWARARPVGLALVLLGAAALLAGRILAPAGSWPGPWLDPAPPLVPSGPTRRLTAPGLGPLESVTRPGFGELVAGVRARAPEGETVSILPEAFDGPTWRDGWHAAWLLWPVRIRMLEPGTDPWSRRGVYLTFDDGPRKPEARVLFKNRAGCLWAVDAGEPK